MNFSSFKAPVKGVTAAWKFENNFRIMILLGIATVGLGFYFGISSLEWLIIIILTGLVLAFELINTFAEHLCDLVNPEYSVKVKYIKDVAAGSVFVICLTSLISAIVIFYPYFNRVLFP